MGEPARVRLEEGPEIAHPVFQHGEPVHAHAEGKALIDIRVQPARLDDVRVHHAAAEDFQPFIAGADLYRIAHALIAHIHLRARLGEGKVVGAEAHLHLVGLEKGRDEVDQAPF